MANVRVRLSIDGSPVVHLTPGEFFEYIGTASDSLRNLVSWFNASKQRQGAPERVEVITT